MTNIRIYRDGLEDLTLPTTGTGQNGDWSPYTGSNWSMFRNVTLGSAFRGSQALTLIPSQLNSAVLTNNATTVSVNLDNDAIIIEFSYSLYITNTTEVNTDVAETVSIILVNSAGDTISCGLGRPFCWHDTVPPNTSPNILVGVTGALINPYSQIFAHTDTPATFELPTAGVCTFNRVRFRIKAGEQCQVWAVKGKGSDWTPVVGQTNYALTSSVGNIVEMRLAFARNNAGTYANDEITADEIVLYREGTNNVTVIGMYDDDGNFIGGVDYNDNGSGSSTGGGNGIGGGGDGGIGDEGLFGGTGAGDNEPSNPSDSSAWRTSGSGINIKGFTVEKTLSEIGIGSLDLIAWANRAALLNTWGENRPIRLAIDGFIIFDGVSINALQQGDYGATLLIRERPYLLTQYSTQYNFGQIINAQNLQAFGQHYNLVDGAVTSTTIKLKWQPPADINFADGNYAIMIVPNPENIPLPDKQYFASSASSYSGNISDLQGDNNSFINSTIEPSGDTLELATVYSGTRANVTGFTVFMKVKVSEVFEVTQTINLDVYNYSTASWELAKNFYKQGGAVLPNINGFPGMREMSFTITGSPTNYINSFNDELTVRIRVTWGGVTLNCVARIYYAYIDYYTDPLYDGTAFPITGISGRTFTVTGNPLTAGVGANDTLVIGRKNTTCLSLLVAEFFCGFTADIDTTFSGYTASMYKDEKFTVYDAIKDILDRENGFWWYDSDDKTIYFRTKANLPTNSYSFGDTSSADVELFYLEGQKKSVDKYSKIVINGAKFPGLDGNEVQVLYELPVSNTVGFPIREIAAENINSKTEAKARADTEKTRLQDASEPIHHAVLPSFEEISLYDLIIGQTASVIARGFTYTTQLLREISINSDLGNVHVELHFGWSGTKPDDEKAMMIGRLNLNKTRVTRSLSFRPKTPPIGSLVSGHRHDGFDPVQETETITTIAAGSSVSVTAQPNSVFGIYLKGNNNAGTFNSATVKLQYSSNNVDWIDLLEYDLTDTTEIDLYDVFPEDVYPFTINLNTKRLEATVYLRYNVTAIDLTGDADLDVSILESNN